MVRLFQCGIVLFWLASLGWLAATVWKTDEAGMVPVDPRRPVETFFGWNNSSQMTLLEGGVRVGQVTVAGFSDGAGEGPDAGEGGFSLTGTLDRVVDDERGGTVRTVGVFWRSLIEFRPGFVLDEANVLFRVPERQLNVQLAVAGPEAVLTARAVMGGNTLFEYDGAASAGNASVWDGLPPLAGQMVAPMLAGLPNPASWDWKVEAFRGRRRFAGRRLPVYLLRLSAAQSDHSLSVYFTESGEPLRIDTSFGYGALSEVLAPLSAFRDRE